MSRRPARFIEADLNRAIKAADRAPSPRSVMIDLDGRIWLVPANNAPERPEKVEAVDNDWSLVE